MELQDLKLKSNLNNTFNSKKADINQPSVLAALITAASKMARCTEFVTEEMTIQQLLDLYQKSDDELVTGLIGMGPQYVKNNIGYSVDFNDISFAQMAYQANKKSYDELYTAIQQRAVAKIEEGPIR